MNVILIVFNSDVGIHSQKHFAYYKYGKRKGKLNLAILKMDFSLVFSKENDIWGFQNIKPLQ